jgi:hypothetical protein
MEILEKSVDTPDLPSSSEEEKMSYPDQEMLANWHFEENILGDFWFWYLHSDIFYAKIDPFERTARIQNIEINELLRGQKDIRKVLKNTIKGLLLLFREMQNRKIYQLDTAKTNSKMANILLKLLDNSVVNPEIKQETEYAIYTVSTNYDDASLEENISNLQNKLRLFK